VARRYNFVQGTVSRAASPVNALESPKSRLGPRAPAECSKVFSAEASDKAAGTLCPALPAETMRTGMANKRTCAVPAEAALAIAVSTASCQARLSAGEAAWSMIRRSSTSRSSSSNRAANATGSAEVLCCDARRSLRALPASSSAGLSRKG
jgi:hypothetical protein